MLSLHGGLLEITGTLSLCDLNKKVYIESYKGLNGFTTHLTVLRLVELTCGFSISRS